MTEGVIEQPQTDQSGAEAVEAPLSISDHAATYGPNATREAEPETPAADLKPIRPVDQQRRDQGKFAEGKQPMRGKDAVTRINTLTARAKTAEERAADLEQRHTATEARLATAEAELAHLRRQGAPKQEIAKAEAKVERAEEAATRAPGSKDDPEPTYVDGEDYGEYLEKKSRWAVRDEYRQRDAQQRQATAQHQQREAATKTLKTFGERITAAKGKYQDFQQVALTAPAPWEEGSAIDAFIMEHSTGADVLYYLQHPSQAKEVGELLTLSPLEQLVRLAAIAQRFSPSTSGTAGSTGSATGRQIKALPKPPNPVRTEAQRASETPPPTDGSLSIAEHGRAFGPKRR